ncbi:Glycosyltransferase family 1 protein [Mycena venus]|uniref:Glycosyltransferase family 1 protein n=1 Tax=Mycena venus TaxID=2733690 RepID=A0A8H6XIF2_9AGAR|nr:Glycosyltransferase family 1 protein [Mycena venus]
MAPSWLAQAKSEIEAQFLAGHEALARIRIISVFQSDAIRASELIRPLAESYPAAYQAIFRGEAITCSTTETTFDSWATPTAIIMDFFSIVQLQQTRAISGTAIPIFAFVSCASAALIRLYGPESSGGLGDFGAKTDAEACRRGKSAAEIGDQILRKSDGSIIRIAGLPPMYDYEFFPQQLPWNIPMAPIVRSGHAMFMQCDGIFINTCEAYDKESLHALDRWISGILGKPLYPLGPLLPPLDGHNPLPILPSEVEIHTFLDNALSQYGEDSTLFISFGTLFWPIVQHHLDELVDVLTEKKFPFIFCHASPSATVSPGLRDKVAASNIGMLTPWCPQQFILSHPAIGWFLSHCGHNSIFEALSNGTPLICWPFDADQPAATAHLTHNLDVAFHLVEVRTGKGLQPLFSGQVPKGTREAVREELERTIDACRSEIGEKKREKAYRLKTEFSTAWEIGGSAKTGINTFLERFVSG